MKNSQPDFSKSNSLIPAIVQDYQSKEVLMLAYMNEAAYQKTLATGYVHFWSRSRKKLWMKGEESGNKLLLKEIFLDCDNDTFLVLAKLEGTCACHTGNKSCFFKKIDYES